MFKIGDVVVLKCGSPRLLVSGIKSGGYVEVTHFVPEMGIATADLDCQLIEIYEEQAE